MNVCKLDVEQLYQGCLFTDEKFFDLDGIYNTQNDRVWIPCVRRVLREIQLNIDGVDIGHVSRSLAPTGEL